MNDEGVEVRFWAVRLLYEHVVDGGPAEDALFEEEFRVLPAISEREAMTRAREAGRSRAEDQANMESSGLLAFRDLLDVRPATGAPAGEDDGVFYRQLTWQELQVLRQTLQPGADFFD